MPSMPIDLIDPEVVSRYIENLGAVGRLQGGGLYRGVYTHAWYQGVGLVRSWMERVGLSVELDPVGNLSGRIAGSESNRKVVSGSHLDTVNGGGKYDGGLGIVAALVAVAGLLEVYGRPRKTLEVLATCEEEGSRFRCNFWGSRAICGLIEPWEASEIRDQDGISIADAMLSCGLDPKQISKAVRNDIDAFIELHIEQGPILESSGCSLGVVDRITGMRQLEVNVTGRRDHAGTTPMDLRRDALVGVAEMIVGIAKAAENLGRPAVATVGSVYAQPGATNVVPGSVAFTVDIRHSAPDKRRELCARVEGILDEVANRRGLKVEVKRLMDHEPVALDERLRSMAVESARAEGVSHIVMASGAGHDSQIIAQRFPTAMLFVPSKDGRSHSPEEYTPIEQIVPGIRVLAQLLYRAAY